MTVCVSVEERTLEAAADKALDRLDCIRGIWNLFENRRHWVRHSGGLRKPVNQILLGPIHTLHKKTGELATDLWWYEPQYRGQVNVYKDVRKINPMYKFMRDVRKLLNASLYKKELVEGILRYVRALDARDWNDAYLRLWSVLEHLTSTVSEPYGVTIRRASFLFEDIKYNLQVLSHLRDIRNDLVHSGSEPNDIEIMMYRLKYYVECLMEFHLANRCKFVSLADTGGFLDVNPDSKWIAKKMRALRLASKFLSN